MNTDDLYSNLLRATDNTNDITNEKFATVTKKGEGVCSVIEDDTNLEHSNVPILNNAPVETGDKIVLGFAENSIYNPYVIGNLTRKNDADFDVDLQMELLDNGYLKINIEINEGDD